MYTIYGISNCDKVKKTCKWFEQQEIGYTFVDFKKNPPTKKLLSQWKKEIGEYPINSRGTTYRKLKDDILEATEANLIKIIVENSSLIKRPIIEKNKKFISIGKTCLD